MTPSKTVFLAGLPECETSTNDHGSFELTLTSIGRCSPPKGVHFDPPKVYVKLPERAQFCEKPVDVFIDRVAVIDVNDSSGDCEVNPVPSVVARGPAQLDAAAPTLIGTVARSTPVGKPRQAPSTSPISSSEPAERPACPVCLILKDQACVDPPPCAGCGTRDPQTCRCVTAEACPVGFIRNENTCACMDRCSAYSVKNCAEFQGCLKAHSGDDKVCNGVALKAQQAQCWSGATGC
jgi:hypothetical protein